MESKDINSVEEKEEVGHVTTSIDEEEQRKRNERIKRFGIVEPIKPVERHGYQNKKQNIHHSKKFKNNQNLLKNEEVDLENIKPIKGKEEFRINIENTSQFIKKRLMLFGVNLMSTDDVEDYFNSKNFKVKKVFWLNDYTCVVEFDSENQAADVFQEFCSFQIIKENSDFDNFNWKKSVPFVIDQDKILELDMRMSEINDLNMKSAREDSSFYKFYNQRRKNIDHRYKHSNRIRERSRNKEI